MHRSVHRLHGRILGSGEMILHHLDVAPLSHPLAVTEPGTDFVRREDLWKLRLSRSTHVLEQPRPFSPAD